MSRLARVAALLLRSRPAGNAPLRCFAPSSTLSSSLSSRFSHNAASSAADASVAADSEQRDRPRQLPDASTRNALLLNALRNFHEREQHFAVPFRFVVPASAPSSQPGDGDDNSEATSDWPRELHGYSLGLRVHRVAGAAVRYKGPPVGAATKSLHAQLVAIGFPLLRWKDYWFDHVYLPALEAYRELEGDVSVPQKLVVPHGDPRWPRAAWGLQLGKRVDKLRHYRDELPPEQVDALDALGFVWNVSDAKWTEYFLPALRRFHELHGHVDVLTTFVVPVDDPRWPRQLAGYQLGDHVKMVRAGKYAAQTAASRDELRRLGFSMSVSDKTWRERILPGLKVFASEFGHSNVPHEFVVPAREPWPASTWGLKLGRSVVSIRRGHYESQTRESRAELDAIGFVRNARHRLEIKVRSVVLLALGTYARLHGGVPVGNDFVVPEADETWPAQTRGFRLGRWVRSVRSGQTELPRHLRDELDATGVV